MSENEEILSQYMERKIEQRKNGIFSHYFILELRIRSMSSNTSMIIPRIMNDTKNSYSEHEIPNIISPSSFFVNQTIPNIEKIESNNLPIKNYERVEKKSKKINENKTKIQKIPVKKPISNNNQIKLNAGLKINKNNAKPKSKIISAKMPIKSNQTQQKLTKNSKNNQKSANSKENNNFLINREKSISINSNVVKNAIKKPENISYCSEILEKIRISKARLLESDLKFFI